MAEIINLLDKIKSYILVIASGLYGLGLICWMYYSWKYNLGHLDAFEAQYFITGIFPALTVLYFYWLITGFRKLSKKTVSWLLPKRIILKIIRFLTSLILLILLSTVFIHLPFLAKLKSHFGLLPIGLQAAIVFVFLNILMLIYPILIENDAKDAKKNYSKFSFRSLISLWHLLKGFYLMVFKFIFWIYLIFAVVMLAVEYVENFYPNLPQELGGVKPKKVILITDPIVFPLTDQVVIFPDSSLIKSGQTDTLLIYFYNGDKVIFKTNKEVTAKGRKAQTFELGRSEVKSIKWIN